ncbi:MAG: hypothetical protein J7M40_14235 [Planctomycetes bacterium]|nr:hypothetical protein [Planctomycetota bacterium]
MLRFLMWLILGALLLLSSCTQTSYTAHAYRLYTLNDRAENLADIQPAISYSDKVDTFYNDDFKLSFDEDLQAFYGKVDAWAEQKHRSETMLSAEDLYKALAILDEPEKADDISPVRQLALRTEQSY